MNSVTGPLPLQGVAMPCWLLRFDRHGTCTSPQTRAALLAELERSKPTDVIVFSHGWNNDFDDATAMYARFMANFEAHCRSREPGRPFRPVFVGVLWPSIWLTFSDGPAIASGIASDGQVTQVLAVLAERVIATGGADGLERLFALLAAPAIDDAAAAELARLVAPAFGLAADEGAAAQGRGTVADDVLAMMRAMEVAQPGQARPTSTNIFDFGRTASGAAAAPAGPQAAGLVGKLDPRNLLRLFSLYQMKDRAGTVGANGVGALLRDLLAGNAALQPDDTARVHVVGHSFGCKVLLSAICTQPLPRPVASALLLQPAISHLSFAASVAGTGQPGGYHAALQPSRIVPPIFSTYSKRDLPLHDAFHLAVRRAQDLGEMQVAGDDGKSTTAGPPPSRFAALGGYGPRDAGQVLVDPLPEAGADIPLPAGPVPIVAFDGSRGAIKGHGDITSPAAAWALHRLVFREPQPQGANHG